MTLATVQRQALAPALFCIGTVEARFTDKIGPTFAGRLKSVSLQTNDTVKAGQLLGEMDPVDLDDKIGAQDATLKRSEANVLARAGDVLQGRVVRLEPYADAVTEEVREKIEFSVRPQPLPPIGELAEVTVALAAQKSMPVVPNASVQRVDGRLGVWLVEDGALRFAPVKTGAADLDGQVQILQGLSGGERVVFIPIKDAREAQFLKDNDAIVAQRARTAQNPVLNRPGVPGLLDAVTASQSTNTSVNAVLVQTEPGVDPETVADPIRRWKYLSAYTRMQMQEILIAKLITTSAEQIVMFWVMLAVVSAAIVAFIIYTLTMGKIREIAVLKLIGITNRTIASLILQQAVALGLIGSVVGKVSATFLAPYFPKYVLLEPGDAVRGFVAVVVICILASILVIRAALKVDPAEAIGG